MKPPKKRSHQRRRTLIWPFWRSRFLRLGLVGLGMILGLWLVINAGALWRASTRPVDAFLVLGGSIQRELYVAEQVKQYPDVPVLISQGSPDPCVLLIFQRAQASIKQVWIEKCADSTFDNFYFSIPILHQWQVHRVKLITSPTHLPRAQWMAQILLGAHGIWVEPDIVQEQGVPGNQESALKTGLDVTRSLIWAIASQLYWPQCSDLTPLEAVDLQTWQQEGFHCERQGNLQTRRALQKPSV